VLTLKGLFVLPQAFIMHKPRNVSNEERKPRSDNPIRINCKGEWMTETDPDIMSSHSPNTFADEGKSLWL